jgi:hypothetical protein
MDPIFVSYATENTPYVAILTKGLLPSLVKFNLPHDYEITCNYGKWARNTQIKADVCYKMLIKHQRPIVMLDADAVIHRPPDLFKTLDDKCDLAFHNLDSELYWKGRPGTVREPLTGTLYINYNPKTLDFVPRWIGENNLHAGRHDMANFKNVLHQNSLNIYQLPIEYVSIILPNGKLPDYIKEPVIVHSQASRKYRRIMK